MKKEFILLFTVIAFLSCSGFAQFPEDSLLVKLLEGNKRFFNQQSIHPDADRQAIAKTVAAQIPSAIILTCSDSRVPPELLFDQGIGDLFVIRVAGNVVDNGELGSIEYAVEHLHVRLILILGHTKCGAVGATVAGGKPEGHISWLVNHIKSSYENVKDDPGDAVDNTVRENVVHSVNEVINDKFLINPALKNNITIAGAVYHIESGLVEITVQPKTISPAR
jgi:carbonic anhydrase